MLQLCHLDPITYQYNLNIIVVTYVCEMISGSSKVSYTVMILSVKL